MFCFYRLQLETAAAAQRIDRIFTPSLSTSALVAEGNSEDKEKDVEKERMDDIHEIPYLLLQDFNPMMVTSTVKKVIFQYVYENFENLTLFGVCRIKIWWQ